jgi:cytochrome c-type biogenesis protein CcmE
MKAGTKFIIGGVLVLATVGYLMATGIKETGVYYLTPSELATRVEADRSFYDVGVKMGARVVTGSITRDVATQTIRFRATDGQHTWPVVYRGLAPDTFTDEVDVVVEGRLQSDGVFHATTLLAKCGSRYEAVPARTGPGASSS